MKGEDLIYARKVRRIGGIGECQTTAEGEKRKEAEILESGGGA